MKYLVDVALCSGHGACAAAGENVYSLDDAGFNAVVATETEVPASLEHEAVAGAEACPDQAIRILAPGGGAAEPRATGGPPAPASRRLH